MCFTISALKPLVEGQGRDSPGLLPTQGASGVLPVAISDPLRQQNDLAPGAVHQGRCQAPGFALEMGLRARDLRPDLECSLQLRDGSTHQGTVASMQENVDGLPIKLPNVRACTLRLRSALCAQAKCACNYHRILSWPALLCQLLPPLANRFRSAYLILPAASCEG